MGIIPARMTCGQMWKTSLQVIGISFVAAFLATLLSAQFLPGDVFVGGNHSLSAPTVYKLSPPAFVPSVFADQTDGMTVASGLTFSPDGRRLFAGDSFRRKVFEFDGAGNATVLIDFNVPNAPFWRPFGENGIAFDSLGNLYVSLIDFNTGKGQIRRYPSDGSPYEIFADENDGIGWPTGLAFDQADNLFVANRNTPHVLKIDPSGDASIFDTMPDEQPVQVGRVPYPRQPNSIDVAANGDIYVSAFDFGGRLRFNQPIFVYRKGEPTRELLTTFRAGGNPSLRLNLDDSVLYYTWFANRANSPLYEIDVQSGSSSLLASGLSGGLSIAVSEGVEDPDPPKLTNQLDPEPRDGWNGGPGFSEVTVTLIADDEGGVGVREIVYSVSVNGDEGPEVTEETSSTVSFELDSDGLYEVSFFARDHNHNSSSSESFVVRIDSVSPRITTDNVVPPSGWFTQSPVDVTFTCNPDGGSPCAADSSSQNFATEGWHRAEWAVEDLAGNQASAFLDFGIDTVPPEIAGIPQKCDLSPPNHKLVTIAEITASDVGVPLDPVITVQSNEELNATGSGRSAPDYVIEGGRVQLRSERSGVGNGRIYRVTATVADRAGQRTTEVFECTVEHDEGAGD